MVMRIRNGIFGALVFGLLMGAPGTPSHAAFVTFGSWSSTEPVSLSPTITVSDSPAGAFLVSIFLGAGDIGSLSGFFFDLNGRNLALGLSTVMGDIMNFNPAVPAGIIAFANNTNNLGGGVNVIPFAPFEAAFSIAQTSVPVTGISFEIKNQLGAVILDDFSRIGLRFQTSNNGPDGVSLDGSDKLVSPIPAALPLFATGLAMLGFMGRRRKRRAAA